VDEWAGSRGGGEPESTRARLGQTREARLTADGPIYGPSDREEEDGLLRFGAEREFETLGT
jgi:hypothetical protein